MIPKYNWWPVCIGIVASIPACVLATAQPPTLRGVERQLTFGTHTGITPAWSPDGTQIVFHSSRLGNYDLWIVPAEGGEPRRLTTDEADDRFPSWSPDGRQIAFVRYTSGLPPYRSNAFVINADGSGEQQLTHDDTMKMNVKWSRSGKSLLYGELAGTPADFTVAIVELSLATKERTPILRDYYGTIAVSPDGRSIAFDFLDESRTRVNLFVLNLDDRKVTPIVTDVEQRIWFPDWSPDGKWIAVQIGKQENAAIWLVSPDGKRRAKVPLGGPSNRFPSWSPDGKKIAFTKGCHEAARIGVFEFEQVP